MRNLFRYTRLFWDGHFHLHLRGSWVSIFVWKAWMYGDWTPYEKLYRIRPIAISEVTGLPIYFGDDIRRAKAR